MKTDLAISQRALDILEQNHPGRMNTLAIFKNEYLLSGGTDGSLAVLHMPTESFFIANSGKSVHRDAIHTIIIGDEYVITTSHDCQSIWDSETWHCHKQFLSHNKHDFEKKIDSLEKVDNGIQEPPRKKQATESLVQPGILLQQGWFSHISDREATHSEAIHSEATQWRRYEHLGC